MAQLIITTDLVKTGQKSDRDMQLEWVPPPEEKWFPPDGHLEPIRK